MDILLLHASQWRTLTITSRLICHANSILALCDCSLPNLESISISVREELDDSVDHDTLDLRMLNASTRLPRLRALYIDQNVAPSPALISPRITIFSLTLRHLHTAVKTSVDKILTLFEALPALQKLSVSLPYQQEREFEPALIDSRLVSLLNLKTLMLTGSPDLFRLLPHLATPALTRLHLRSSIMSLGYPDVEIGDNIRRYIESTSPPLELLDFHDIDLSPSNFIACFARLHRLKDLRLHESDIPDSILELFAQPDGLCPSIIRLDLRWCSQVTGPALVNFIHNRLRHSRAESGGDLRTQPINQITVINCCFVKEEDLLQISETTAPMDVVEMKGTEGDFFCMGSCEEIALCNLHYHYLSHHIAYNKLDDKG
ncbi:hypothetical protein H0H92_010524 [Tricholoma furcatifolium]|nr:hypothetical protein H0H92_010524 [Tricholoma furcatifolium]